MASACTLSRRSVYPACASAPSAPALPADASCSPLGDFYAKPAASAGYPPMTFAEVGAPAAGVPVPCPPTPAPAAPFAPAPSAASSASYSMPSPAPSAACYPAAQPQPAAAYGMPPPAPHAQFAYPPPADDKVQPRGCFNCSPETGAAVGTVIGGALAVVGLCALEFLRFAIIFL